MMQDDYDGVWMISISRHAIERPRFPPTITKYDCKLLTSSVIAQYPNLSFVLTRSR